MASSTLLPIATSAGMAACSLGLTRYVYSKTYKASTLNFGILTTTGFTLSALFYTVGGRFEITGALIGGGTSALLAGMTTASAFRSRRPAPAIVAILSYASLIVHTSTIEKIARRRKAQRDLQNGSVQQGGNIKPEGTRNKQEEH